MKPVLRDHYCEKPPVLKDHISLAEDYKFQCIWCNWTCHQRHLSLETIFLQPMEWSYKTGSAVLYLAKPQTWFRVTNSASNPTTSPSCGSSPSSRGTKVTCFLRGVTKEESLYSTSEVMGSWTGSMRTKHKIKLCHKHRRPSYSRLYFSAFTLLNALGWSFEST